MRSRLEEGRGNIRQERAEGSVDLSEHQVPHVKLHISRRARHMLRKTLETSIHIAPQASFG